MTFVPYDGYFGLDGGMRVRFNLKKSVVFGHVEGGAIENFVPVVH
jgi:hypothetical protein